MHIYKVFFANRPKPKQQQEQQQGQQLLGNPLIMFASKKICGSQFHALVMLVI